MSKRGQLSGDEKNLICQYVSEGKNDEQIAKSLDRSVVQVSNYIKDFVSVELTNQIEQDVEEHQNSKKNNKTIPVRKIPKSMLKNSQKRGARVMHPGISDIMSENRPLVKTNKYTQDAVFKPFPDEE